MAFGGGIRVLWTLFLVFINFNPPKFFAHGNGLMYITQLRKCLLYICTKYNAACHIAENFRCFKSPLYTGEYITSYFSNLKYARWNLRSPTSDRSFFRCGTVDPLTSDLVRLKGLKAANLLRVISLFVIHIAYM